MKPTGRRQAFAAGLAGLAAVSIAACSGTTAGTNGTTTVVAGKPQPGGTLTIGETSQPLSGLDPIMAQSFNSKRMVSQFYEGLLSLGKQPGQLEPALATKWQEVSPTDYVFTLRHGVKFHNGDTMTPADVVYSLDRIVDPAQNSPYQSLYSFKSVTATGPDTVEVKLASPQASLLDLLAQPWSGGIVDKAWIEAKSANALKTQENGTGPFTLTSYQIGSLIQTARFAGYWDSPRPYLSAVNYRVFPDESTLVQALASGSVDMGQVTLSTSLDQLKSRGLQVGPGYQTGTEWIGLNTLSGPLANLKVRQAISLALNREQLIQIASQGTGVLASTVPPGDPLGCQMSGSSPDYADQIAKAKSLLAGAGQPHVSLTIKIESDADGAKLVQTAQLMKQQLGAIGVNLNIDTVPFTDLVNGFLAGTWGSDMIALTSTLNADASQYLALWFAKGAAQTKVHDPRLTAMMASAVSETGGQAARKADYQKICNYVAANVYQIVPFASPGRWDVWSPKLVNFYPDVTQTRLFLKDAWLR